MAGNNDNVDISNIIALSEYQQRQPEWAFELAESNGKPIPNLRNAVRILRMDPFFDQLFAYDQMLCSVVLLRSIDDKRQIETRPLTDVDVSRIQEVIQDMA